MTSSWTATGSHRVTRALVVPLAVLAVLVVSLQLWPYATPPLIDWPNHLARHVLQCGAPGAEFLGRYYSYQLQLVPNLAAELVHTSHLACGDPDLTQKVLIQVSTFGLFAATMVLHRAIWGAWSAWPVLSALIMHNMAWAYGFENFVLAVPVTLLILALWFALDSRSVGVRLGLLWPVVLLNYVLHLYAFGFLILTLSLLELQRCWKMRKSSGALHRTAATVGLLAALALLPGVHLHYALAASPEIQAGTVQFGGFIARYMAFVSPVAGFGNVIASNETLAVATLLMLALVGLPCLLALRGGTIELDRRLRLAGLGMLLLSLLVPFMVSGVYLTNIRFPVLTAALLIAGTRVSFTRSGELAFVVAVVGLALAKVSWIESKWEVQDAQVAELREAGAILGPEDRVLVARANYDQDTFLHSHIASYLAVDRGLYWSGLFTGGNSLSARPAYELSNMTQAFPLDWRLLTEPHKDHEIFADGEDLHGWRAFYTHLLILRSPGAAPPDASELGEKVVEGSFYDIYRIAQIQPLGLAPSR